jgi:hypothetical protein
MWYHVYDEISGDSGDFNASSPKVAAIKYLKIDTEPNKSRLQWTWTLNVCRKYPNRKSK